MMASILAFLLHILEPFRFLKHARERSALEAHLLRAERARERAHQQDMLESIFSRIESSQKATMEGFVEMAKGTQEQAKAFHTWLEMFQSSSAPESSTVRDSDEWLAEQQRLKDQGFPVDMPVEFQLAAILKSMDEDDKA